MTLRILLVDEHEVVRIGLRTLIERQGEMRVIGEAGNAREALDQVSRLTPDMVVLGIQVPGHSGVELCRAIKTRWPHVRVVILSAFPSEELLFEAINAGADGYILKEAEATEVIRALERVGRGESILDPAITKQVLLKTRAMYQKKQAEAFADLTMQEMHILALISEGQTNADIGKALHLSEKTVRNYVSEILRKLNLSSRTQAAAYAAKHHIEDYIGGKSAQ